MMNIFKKKKSNNYALLTFNNNWTISTTFITKLIEYFEMQGIFFEYFLFDDCKYKTHKGEVKNLKIKKTDKVISMILYNGKQSSESDFKVQLFFPIEGSFFFGYFFIEIIDSLTFDIEKFIVFFNQFGFVIDYGFSYEGEINKYSISYLTGEKVKKSLWGVSTEIDDYNWKNNMNKVSLGYLRSVYSINILNQNQINFLIENDFTLNDLIITDERFGSVKNLGSIYLWLVKKENLDWVRDKILNYKIIL